MSVTSSWTSSRNTLGLSASKTLNPTDSVVIETETEGITIANGQTDKAISIGGIDVSQLVHVWMHSTAALTIETNHTAATGGNTIVLAADVPLLWCTGAPFSNPLTNDVTVMYATNSGGSSANLKMRFVQDGTA